MTKAEDLPDVDAIIATKDRRELLLKAIEGIVGQDYEGEIRLTIVFDDVPPDPTLERTWPGREVRVTTNERASGLAGARNTGLLRADHPLVAFCDDDDIWRPHKLRAQVHQMRADDSQGCVTGIMIHSGERRIPRIPDVTEISAEELTHSRLTGAHPSSFVFRRPWLLEDVGTVDEHLPFGYGEDFDLLLRASRAGTISIVAQPLVDVLWHSGSFFTQRWAGMAAGLGYLLNKHTELAADRRGFAWIEGQRAFALAAKGGDRREAQRAAMRSIRSRAAEPRGWLAIAVSLGVLDGNQVLRFLNARGRGI